MERRPRDDADFSGSATATLSVLTTGSEHEAVCTCLVSNPDGSVVSADAILAVRASCSGDTNEDGNVDLADLNAVLGAFGTTCP